MRKNIFKVFACAMAMTLSLSLFACGKDEDKDTKTKTEDSSNTDADSDSQEDADSDENSSSDASNDSEDNGSFDADNDSEDNGSSDNADDEKKEKFESIDAYLNDDAIKIQLDAMIESLEGSGMTMEIKADGNKLIYRYTYTNIVKAEGMDETLKEGLEEQASSFSEAAASIKDAVDVKNPVLVIEYADANGELILSQEFTAE